MCICACECGTRVYSTRTGPGLERTCVFVCACECGTHVYSTRHGPGLVCVLPTGRGARTGFLLGLCATFPRVHVRYGVRLGQCEQCIMYVCVCSCMAVGVCSSSVVPLVVSTCMRTLYSIWHGGLGGVRSIQGCYLHVCTERAPLEQCSAWLVRAYVLILFVLVPRVYPLYMPVRVMYLLTRACARTALVPSHNVYCIVPLVQCTGEPVFVLVLWLYHCTVCTVLVPLVQWCSVASAGNVSFTRFYTRAVLVLLHSRHG